MTDPREILTFVISQSAPVEVVGVGGVDSVNEKTGAVVLGAADVGAQPAGDYVTDDTLTEALAGKQPKGDYVTAEAMAEGLAGKGTSNLALGTTEETAKAGDWKPTIEDMPPGYTTTVKKVAGTWPPRPTARTDVTVNWLGSDPDPLDMLESDWRTVPQGG